VLFGRVVQRDGRVCNYGDPAFGVDARAQVTVLNPAAEPVASSVDVNNEGEYLVPAVPLGSFSVRASCELSNVTAAADTQEAKHTKLDLTLPNTSPEITTLAVTAGGRGVYRVQPGTTVQVSARARDADGDSLQYRWFANGGTFVAHDGGAADWKLPDGPGLHTMYLLVSDGKGGYAFDHVELSTAAATQLAGQVVGEAGEPVAQATVSMDGVSASTDAQGHFQLSLQGDEDRHVLTILKGGHQLVSRIVQGPLTGGDGQFRLSAARTFVVDPASRISIVDRPKRAGQRGAEVSIAASSLAPVADRASAAALVASVTTIDPTDPEGGLPGDGSAVNARGERVRMESLGAVEVEFRDLAGNLYNLIDGRTATVRIPVQPERARRGELPSSAPVWFYDVASGLWREDGVARLAGNFYEAVVKHFSVIDIGYPQPNVTCARVRTSQMMVARGYLTMPYNVQITLSLNGAGSQVFVGTIDNPLSAIINLPVSTAANIYSATVVPLLANGTPNPAFNPVSFTTDNEAISPSTPPTYPFDACRSVAAGLISGLTLGGRVDVNFAPREPSGGFLTFAFGPGSDPTAALYYSRIDPSVVQGPQGTTVDCYGNPDPLEVIGTGTSFTTFFVPGDIIDCGTAPTDEVRTVVSVTSDTRLRVSSAFTVSSLRGVSYAQMGSKTTFAHWKTANGFDGHPGGDNEAEAIYFNDGDLGFGRWMNMRRNPNGFVAYYVSNFKDADKAIAGRGGNLSGLIATVAMEYSPITGPLGNPITKFYVFNNQGARVDFADLDGRNAKFVPHLCVICHGGSVPPAPSPPPADLTARFIGFDLKSFAFSSNPLWTQAQQELQFRTLNRRVLDTVPGGCDPSYQGDYRTICALIHGWYGGPSMQLTAQKVDFVPDVTCPSCVPPEPDSWNSTPANQNLYRNVVFYCRSCHSTRAAYLDWGTASLFRNSSVLIQQRVCGQPNPPFNGRQMPQALRTWYNFWTSTGPANDFSPHAPFILRDALGITCTPPAPLQ
jgi:hypothetical protein